MASGPPPDASSLENRRWDESKVYTRKIHNKNPTTNSTPIQNPHPSQIPPPPPPPQTLTPPGNPPSANPRRLTTINLSSKTKHQLRELRNNLTSDLLLVRSLATKLAARQLSASQGGDAMEKEKRTPKANQHYKKADFLLGKEKLPRKAKANGSKNGMQSLGFRKCGALLSKMMRHGHGWVFNTPVDADALSLPDYHRIVEHPMDLGTVKSRLSKNWYESPREFSEDVRLTFRNAMAYNPKGQDVHVMARQLSQFFEERWAVLEAELECSDSAVDLKTKSTNETSDMNKREMSFDEKQRLSDNLQKLPSEKLDEVVQIIRKRSFSVSQHEDEIEVDIDSVDTETLWELDGFITNYKKSLSKNKRKAALAMLERVENEQHSLDMEHRIFSDAAPRELLKERKTVLKAIASSPAEARIEVNGGRSSSSSSDSGSTSGDSDSDSSTGYESDAAQPPEA